jgi:hypothetical protein
LCVVFVAEFEEKLLFWGMTQLVKIAILGTFEDARFQLLTVVGVDSSLVGHYIVCASSY